MSPRRPAATRRSISSIVHPQVTRKTDRPAAPRRPRGFVGRTAELAQLDQQITAREALTLYAPDGAGKSTLLKQAANGRAAQALPDGVAFLEGADLDGTLLGPNDLIQRLFEKYFIADPPLNVNADSAQPHLSSLQSLIVIDGAQLPARLIERLPDICRNSAIVISGTQPPAGDATLPLKIAALQRADALQLFALRANLIVNDASQPALEAICALLADVPLALVIGGNIVREAELTLEHMQTTLTALTITTSDPLRAGVERALQLAYSILTVEEKGIIELIAALPGLSHNPDRLRQLLGLDVESRERIAETDTDIIIGTVKLKKRVPGPIGLPDLSSSSPDKYGAALERLQRLSLVYTNSPRLRLAPGLRRDIQTKTSAAGWQERLLAQLLIDAQQNRFKSDQFCQDELGNILGSIAWAAQQGHEAAALELSRAISPHLTHFGLWDAWGSLLNRALHAAQVVHDQHAEAWALHQLGTRAALFNQTEAITLLKQALELRRTDRRQDWRSHHAAQSERVDSATGSAARNSQAADETNRCSADCSRRRGKPSPENSGDYRRAAGHDSRRARLGQHPGRAAAVRSSGAAFRPMPHARWRHRSGASSRLRQANEPR